MCQSAEDRDLLLAELSDRQKLPVNATFLAGNVNRERRADLAPLKQFGIVAYPFPPPLFSIVISTV